MEAAMAKGYAQGLKRPQDAGTFRQGSIDAHGSPAATAKAMNAAAKGKRPGGEGASVPRKTPMTRSAT
jgi:hypothetical protein